MSKDSNQQLKSYSLSVEIKNISYGFWEYDKFIVREVNKDGKSIGEYHIKMKTGVKTDNIILFFKGELGGDAEIGLIDPDGILNLEYPIYIKVGDLLIDGMQEAFEDMNKTLCNFKK